MRDESSFQGLNTRSRSSQCHKYRIEVTTSLQRQVWSYKSSFLLHITHTVACAARLTGNRKRFRVMRYFACRIFRTQQSTFRHIFFLICWQNEDYPDFWVLPSHCLIRSTRCCTMRYLHAILRARPYETTHSMHANHGNFLSCNISAQNIPKGHLTSSTGSQVLRQQRSSVVGGAVPPAVYAGYRAAST